MGTKLINELTPINKLSYVILNVTEINNTYVFVAETNLKTVTYDTYIEPIQDLTDGYILDVLNYLKGKFNSNFQF